MKTIHKYVLPLAYNEIQVPACSQVLHVAEQRGQLCLWMEVDPAERLVRRRFVLVGTGHFLPEGPHKHLATVLLHNGALVLHVYEIGN